MPGAWPTCSPAHSPISGFSPAFRFLGAGEVLYVPTPTILFLSSVAVAALVLERTRLGRYMYAIGGNCRAATLSGIRVDWYTAVAYVVCGLTAAISAVVLTARLNAAESIAGTGYELDVIASVVIGGTSLAGGRGSVWGTLLGALLIGTINNGMNCSKYRPIINWWSRARSSSCGSPGPVAHDAQSA